MVPLSKVLRAVTSIFWIVILLILETCVQGTHFVVKVSPNRIAQVEARYTSNGFLIKEMNVQRRYIVVAPPGSEVDLSPVPSASPAPDADTSVVGGEHLPAADAFGNPTPSPGGEEPWLAQQSSNAVVATSSSSSGSGREPARILPLFSLQHSSAQHQSTASAADGSPTGTDQVAEIGGEGVEKVVASPTVRLLTHRTWRQQQQQSRNKRLLQESSPVTAAGSCPLVNAADDSRWQLGNITEVTPYAVKLAEADLQDIIQISREYSRKVLYCVIDTGLDATNGEFDQQTTSGCVPDTLRPDGSQHLCNWAYDDISRNTSGSHGTHVSGTIAARRNGRGLVGVSAEGAQLYHYNIFGQRETFEFIEAIRAWDDCIAELEYRRKALETPDMKLVISMSWGARDDLEEAAKYLNETAKQRADILFVGAAGNDFGQQLVFPAASAAVVSVAAVDWQGVKADFSTWNADVEWAAGGVNVVSTMPGWVSSSRFITDAQLTCSPFNPPPDDLDVLINPRVLAMGGTGLGTVTGQMVDCGLAMSPCVNATGKICLIQRGETLFCNKVWNCVNGGGVAAVVYARDDQAECEQVTAVTLLSDSCETPSGGWPITLTASRKQGTFLKQAIQKSPDTTVTLNSGQADYSLGAMSGTSMATPAAAGVAGLVWSAHTDCTAEEIRAAISATAHDQGPAGWDPHYGFGIVKTLAAHKYLQANHCTGSNPSRDCAGSWSAWSACNSSSRLQYSTYSVRQSAFGSGVPCKAQTGAVRSRTCVRGPLAVSDTVMAISNRWEYLDVVQNDIGSVVAITLPSSKSAQGAQLKLQQLSPERSKAESNMPKAALDTVVAYLTAPGFTGIDSFRYNVVDTQGRKSNGQVIVNVTAGSCSSHACRLGKCSAGKCRCRTAAGLINAWIPNPDLAQRALNPTVPACRYKTIAAVPPFSFAGSTAARGRVVALGFTIGVAGQSKCFSMAVIPIANVTFSLQNPVLGQAASCPDSQAVSGLTESSATPGTVTCAGGKYRYVVRVPSVVGCYQLKLQLADSTVRLGSVRVV